MQYIQQLFDLYPIIFGAIVAMSFIGLVLGAVIGIVAKFFKVEVDSRIELVSALLPGANCGGCGQAGCADFARAVVDGKMTPNQCPVSSQAIVSSIARALGIESSGTFKQVALVMCGGDINQTQNPTMYNGVSDCVSASLVAGGPKGCSYGCLGLSSCSRSCPFGAIEIINGLAIVHAELCVGCGKCVNTCPRRLIKLVPADRKNHVYCNNPEKAPFKKKFCKVSCIGCRKCDKVASGKFKFSGFLAAVDYDAEILTDEEVIASACPGKCLMSASKHLAQEHSDPDNAKTKTQETTK